MHSSQFSLSLYVSSSLSLRFFLYSGRRQSQWLHKDKKTAPPDRRRAKKEKPGTHNTKSKSEHTKKSICACSFHPLYQNTFFSQQRQQQKNERLRPQEWETSKAHHLALLWMQCPGAALGRFVCFCDRKSNKRKKAKMATHH